MNGQQYNPYSPYLSAHVGQQPNRGDDILQSLMGMFGTMPQGDGVRTFNPMPSIEQMNNILRRALPQQDGAREFSLPQPDVNMLRDFAMQYMPRKTMNNRIY